MRSTTCLGRGAALAVAVGLGACDSVTEACSSEFRAEVVTLIDSAGAPVTDAGLTTMMPRTGDTLRMTFLGLSPAGTYIYLDDSAIGTIRESGDSLRVDVERSGGGASFSVAYLFDVPGGCHIRRVTGPDTVVVP